MTDLYELTMAAAYVAEGMDARPATFSLFARSLPASRGYLVAAGLDDALAFLEALHFEDRDLEVLARLGLFSDPFLEHLERFRFTGSVRAVPEGRVVLANEPLLEVDGPLLEAQLVETALLSRITYQTGIATKASRLYEAAAGRPISDFGLRSSYGPEAGLRLARAARIGGLASTSNVAGAHHYGLATSGTMAHSFVLAHPNETVAFESFVRHFGERSVLLVDTYDAVEGTRTAVGLASRLRDVGAGIAGLRLDSGNIDALSRHARNLLDAAQLSGVQIFATGGLDERAIERLISAGAPVDGFGVGAALAVPNDGPSLETTYKLVELDGRPVRKLSAGKITWAGAKQVWRRPGDDLLALRDEDVPSAGEDGLLIPVMADGRRLGEATGAGGACDPAAAARRLQADRDLLPPDARRTTGPRAPVAMPSPGLVGLTEALSRQGR